MATLNATSTVVSNSFQSVLDTVKPEVAATIYYNHLGYVMPALVLETLGRSRVIANDQAEHFEAGWTMPNFHVHSDVAPVGAGNPITFRVATADVIDDTVFPRRTFYVRFKNNTSGEITAVTKIGANNWEVTVEPHNTAFNLSVSANDGVWILANAQNERSSGVDPATTGRQKFTYGSQTIREAATLTGNALTNQLWYQVDQNGQSRENLKSEAIDAEARLMEQISNALIWNPSVNNPNITAPYMTSLNTVATTQGNTVPYPLGNFGVTEIVELTRYAQKMASGRNFCFMMGPDLGNSATTGLSDIFAQNPSNFGSVGSSEWNNKFQVGDAGALAKTLGVDITFSKITWNGVTFHLVPVPQWGLKTTGGEAGFTETGSGFIIPLDKKTDGNGELRSRLEIFYKGKGQYQRKLIMAETGMLANTPTNTTDELRMDWLSQVGASYFGAVHFQKVVQG